MSALFSVSASGMQAAQTTLDASAHNIAKLGTSGFRRQQVVRQSSATGGVETKVAPASVPGQAPEIDLVAPLQARSAFQLNAVVFKTNERMLGSLFDSTG
jgi:hypothetical protein